MRCATALRLILCTICWLGLGTIPTRASAESAREEASGLLREGTALYHAKQYAAALERFRQAQRRFPSYKIDLNLGLVLHALGRTAEAATCLSRFLAAAKADTSAQALEQARARLLELERGLGRLRLRCRAGAQVLLDDRAAGRTPLAAAIYLQPGRHRLVVEAKGFRRCEREVVLPRGGELVVDVDLERAPATTSATAPARTPRAQPPRTDETPVAAPRRTTWAWVTLGAGLALAATAGVLYGVGASAGQQAYDRYREAQQPELVAEHRRAVESAETKIVAGHVLAGVGAVAIGVAVFRLARGRSAAPGAPPSGAGLLPGLGRDGATLWLRARF
jgi:tetratricopeptide (TPR) repeat protein